MNKTANRLGSVSLVLGILASLPASAACGKIQSLAVQPYPNTPAASVIRIDLNDLKPEKNSTYFIPTAAPMPGHMNCSSDKLALLNRAMEHDWTVCLNGPHLDDPQPGNCMDYTVEVRR